MRIGKPSSKPALSTAVNTGSDFHERSPDAVEARHHILV